jgi:ATP-dependent Zn protease
MAAPWVDEPEPDWRHLAELTARWSPADIRGAVDDAVGLALLRAGRGARVTEEDLVQSVRRGGEIQPEDDDQLAELPQVAIHEAGHVACAIALGRTVRAVHLRPGHRGGETLTGDEGGVATGDDLWAGIVSALGGTAAEELLCESATVGGASDVHRATELLLLRIEAGLDPAFPPVSRRAWGMSWTPLALDDLLVPRVVAELAVARADARAIVEREQERIRSFAEILLDRQVLTGPALEGALRAVGWLGDQPAPRAGPTRRPDQGQGSDGTPGDRDLRRFLLCRRQILEQAPPPTNSGQPSSQLMTASRPT